MNFPTDVTKAITCLLLHACAQKVRILRPLGGAWDFSRGTVGFQLDELAGPWNFILPNFVDHSARSVLNHNGNWENTQSVWCQTRTDSTTSELTERLQNDQLLPKRPTPRPHTSNFPTDVSERNFVAETDYPLIPHSQIL